MKGVPIDHSYILIFIAGSVISQFKKAARNSEPLMNFPCYKLVVRNKQLMRTYTTIKCLNIQIRHIQSILLDELPARLHLITHQYGKDLLCADDILNLYL